MNEASRQIADGKLGQVQLPGPIVNRNGFEPSFDPSVLIDMFEVKGHPAIYTAVARFDRAGVLRSFECTDDLGTPVSV